jgi:cytochrome c oxidase subunit 2
MDKANNRPIRRVLIASANPLFAKGLEKIYGEHWGKGAVELSLANSMGETLTRLESWNPDLVIVDYDDRTIHREEFLTHFIVGDRPMQVMLVSLQASGEVVVYDRRTMTPAQAGDWLSLPQSTAHTSNSERSEKHMKGSKQYVIVGLLVVAATAGLFYLMQVVGLLPVQGSAQAVLIDKVFNLHFLLIAFFYSLIAVFVFYSIVVFRAKKGDKSFGEYFSGNSRLEVIWTIVPLIIVLAMAFYGARNLAEVRAVDPDAMLVKVTAGQWNWQFEYPEYGIKSKELYLPVNRQVLLRMTSRDVIHSFWVPEFRVKQDILPGANLVKELRLTPIRIGEYQVLCAELCGGAHADMTAPVKVVEQAAFQQWAAGLVNKAVKDPIERGKTFVEANGCASCHSADGSRLVGPSFKGLYGSEVELVDGTKVSADASYLQKSILEPNAQIVKGYAPNVMPGDFGYVLTADQVNDIIEYVKTLK